MAFTAIVAIALAWFVRQSREAENERRAKAAINGVGGIARFNDEWPRNKRSLRGKPDWCPRLLRQLKRDLFSYIVRVDFQFDEKDSDAKLVHVARLGRLEELSLGWSSVTNAGLVYLVDLSNLRLLELNDTSIDDRGLVHLRRLARLRALNLDNTDVSDAGLASLASLSQLEELSLADTDVGDRGLVHLQQLPRLRILNLSHTRVTNRGMVYLEILKNLELLDVGFTMVNDFGAHDLRDALPKVKVLYTSYVF